VEVVEGSEKTQQARLIVDRSEDARESAGRSCTVKPSSACASCGLIRPRTSTSKTRVMTAASLEREQHGRERDRPMMHARITAVLILCG